MIHVPNPSPHGPGWAVVEARPEPCPTCAGELWILHTVVFARDGSVVWAHRLGVLAADAQEQERRVAEMWRDTWEAYARKGL